MTRISYKKILFSFLLFLVLFFIFGNSLLNGEQSIGLSDPITDLLARLVVDPQAPIAEQTAAVHRLSKLVRKTAHATEFCMLAVTGCLLLAVVWRLSVRAFFPYLWLFGVLTALTDETIQLHTGRTSSVTDVWIDFSGFTVGLCLTALLLHRMRKRRRQKLHGT